MVATYDVIAVENAIQLFHELATSVPFTTVHNMPHMRQTTSQCLVFSLQYYDIAICRPVLSFTAVVIDVIRR